MPIDTRPPEVDQGTAARVAEVEHLGGGSTIGITAPVPEALLPSGDLLVFAPSPMPAVVTTTQRALASDALRVARRLACPDRRPTGWDDERVARDVELIRRHLAPFRTRRALAASFGREAFHVRPASADDRDAGPVRLAYAVRWLELGDGVMRPPWSVLLGR
ncbi:MAG TPA: hypothetical protein VD763_07795 [Candidatus Saccharimonadales bacterium]|nr:hypothetical protein [Candidatus Saccharimonadales bacterium]